MRIWLAGSIIDVMLVGTVTARARARVAAPALALPVAGRPRAGLRPGCQPGDGFVTNVCYGPAVPVRSRRAARGRAGHSRCRDSAY
jgi:hypothetical protein